MLEDYLKALLKTAKQADATEPSYYPALKSLLEALAEESGQRGIRLTQVTATASGYGPKTSSQGTGSTRSAC